MTRYLNQHTNLATHPEADTGSHHMGGGGKAGSTELNYHNPISSLHQSVYVIIEHARNLGKGGLHDLYCSPGSATAYVSNFHV